jgi:hypothetical protein
MNRDDFFRSLLDADGYLDEWDGDQEAATGYFGHITIANIDEAVGLWAELYGVAPTLEQRQALSRPEAFSNPGVVGNFLVRVDSDGNTTVQRFATIGAKLSAYGELVDEFYAMPL